MVEIDALGGTCLNRGCIPAKAFLETAAVHRHVAHAAEFGIEAGAPSVNFAVTQERKQKIVAGLVGGIAAMCKGRKVEVFNGVGSLGPDHTVTVTSPDGSTTQITGTNVILAAGSVPRLIPGFERGGPIMTSDEVLDLDHVPAAHGRHRRRRDRLRVRLGVRRPRLAGHDPRGRCRRSCPGSTTTSPTSSCAASRRRRSTSAPASRSPATRRTTAAARPSTSARASDLEVDAVVVSVGRRPFADKLGLDGTGVKVDERGFVVVDEFCRTGEDGVYADRRPHQHAAARPRRLRRGDPVRQADARREGRAGDVRPGAVGDLLRPRGGVGRARRGRRPRRPASTSSSPSTRSSSTRGPRSSARPRGCARSSPRRGPTARPGGSSACTWSGRG